MRNRYLVLGLTAFIAVALAVPALGGPSNPISKTAATAKSTAKKALKKARQANTAANNAQATADAAQGAANQARTIATGAQTTANEARTAAQAAQTTANGAQTAAAAAQAAANAAQATANSKFGTITNVEGATSATNNANKPVVFAICPGGSNLSGGGWILSGAGSNNARVIFNTAYGQAWGVQANDDAAAGTWSITATARCASP